MDNSAKSKSADIDVNTDICAEFEEKLDLIKSHRQVHNKVNEVYIENALLSLARKQKQSPHRKLFSKMCVLPTLQHALKCLK